MEFLRRHRRRFAALLIFAAAWIVRSVYATEVRGTALDEWHRFDQSDMATYLAQAEQFRREGWFVRDPVHPYHRWQSVAPPEKWLEWYGPRTYHQAPGYAAMLALAGGLSNDPVALAKRAQVFIGAAGSVFAFWLAEALFGWAVACVAGLLVACYAPLVFVEHELLRDGPMLAAFFGLSYAVVLALQSSARRRSVELARAAAVGAGVGLFHIFHEMGTVLLVAFALAWLIARRREPWFGRLAPLAALGVGYVVGFAPLVARNLDVGAKPFSVSCRTLINFAEANVADAEQGGATFSAPGESVVRVLDGAQGSFPRMLGLVWDTYRGDFGLALKNWSLRFREIWKRYEEPDNASFDFHRTFARSLAWLPDFGWLFPLGLAGAIAVAIGTWSARRGAASSLAAWSVAAPGHIVLVAWLVCAAEALAFVHTVARFRLYVTPFYFVYAAWAIVAFLSALRERAIGRAALLSLLAVGALWIQGSCALETDRSVYRPVDFYVAAHLAAEDGRFAEALRFADDSALRYTGDLGIYTVIGGELESRGAWAPAAAAYQRALARDPDAAAARAGLARAQAALGRRP